VLITLRHLLVLILLISGSMVAVASAAGALAVGEQVAVVAALLSAPVALVLFGWPIFRLLSLRPLTLPYCPHCGNRHANYHVPPDAWPYAVIVCIHCGQPLRLILSTSRRVITPSPLATVALRWPGFLGLWRRVTTAQTDPQGNSKGPASG
jgi:hypothetical protein